MESDLGGNCYQLRKALKIRDIWWVAQEESLTWLKRIFWSRAPRLRSIGLKFFYVKLVKKSITIVFERKLLYLFSPLSFSLFWPRSASSRHLPFLPKSFGISSSLFTQPYHLRHFLSTQRQRCLLPEHNFFVNRANFYSTTYRHTFEVELDHYRKHNGAYQWPKSGVSFRLCYKKII